MTKPAAQPPVPAEIVKVSGPQGLAASVPYLLGFHPTESIVLLCTRGPRRRMGPVLRIDLPVGPAASLATAEYLAGQAARHATAVAVICYTEEADRFSRGKPRFPQFDLVSLCLDELKAVGVPIFDAMLVRGNLIWSYLQHDPGIEGYPLPEAGDPQIGHLASAHVGTGRAVLASRAALAESIAGPTGIPATYAEQKILSAATRHATDVGELNYQQMVALGCAKSSDRLVACLAANGDGKSLRSADVADLTVLMMDSNIRDSVVSWALQRISDGPLALFVDLARRTPDEYATQICTALAIIAYRSGDGALAQVALDRVLAAEPRHRMAGMMVELFSSGIRPDGVDYLIFEWPEHPANPNAPFWTTPRPVDENQIDLADDQFAACGDDPCSCCEFGTPALIDDVLMEDGLDGDEFGTDPFESDGFGSDPFESNGFGNVGFVGDGCDGSSGFDVGGFDGDGLDGSAGGRWPVYDE